MVSALDVLSAVHPALLRTDHIAEHTKESPRCPVMTTLAVTLVEFGARKARAAQRLGLGENHAATESDGGLDEVVAAIVLRVAREHGAVRNRQG